MKSFESKKNSEDFQFFSGLRPVVAKQRVFQSKVCFRISLDFSQALCGQQVHVTHHVDDIQALCQGSRWKTSIHEVQSVTMRSLQQRCNNARKTGKTFRTFTDFYFSHILTTNLQLVYV